MSEGAPFCLNRYDGERKLLSVGNPVPETEVEVVDLETGTRVLPMGEAGEVRVRGPQMMIGYHNKPEETAYALRDGYMYTGDIGYVDQDGFLFLVDRKKEMIIVGGYNVYPREVDEVLFNHPAIHEAATVGKRDDRLGEVVVAFVAVKNGSRTRRGSVLCLLQGKSGQVQTAGRSHLHRCAAADPHEQDRPHDAKGDGHRRERWHSIVVLVPPTRDSMDIEYPVRVRVYRATMRG